MRPSEVLALHRDAVVQLTARWNLTNPRVFGSVLNHHDNDQSDLDILVDAPNGATLLALGGLQNDLEELLGVRVDLLTPTELPVGFRDKVLAEARPV